MPCALGIVHMNRRLYDPKFHRFLQPDNNIQDPFNTQNFNRYGYVLNNPLKYTDKNGEFWDIVAGFFFSLYVHGGAASGGEVNPLKWDSNTWSDAFAGTISTIGSNAATVYTNDYIDNYNNRPQLGPSAISSGNSSPVFENNEGHKWLDHNSDPQNYGDGAILHQTRGSVFNAYFSREGEAYSFKGNAQFLSGSAYYATGAAEAGGLDFGAEASIFKNTFDKRIGTQDYNVHTNTTNLVGGLAANVNAGLLTKHRGKMGLLVDGNSGAYGAKTDFTIGATIFGITYDATFTGSIASAHAGYTGGLYLDSRTNVLTLTGGEHLGFGLGEGASATLQIPLNWLLK
jgi:RHS repeat-associated protein